MTIHYLYIETHLKNLNGHFKYKADAVEQLKILCCKENLKHIKHLLCLNSSANLF